MELSKGYRSVLQNAAFVYASLLINQISRAAYVIVLARILGPELYGLLAYGQAWYLAFLPLSLVGLGPMLVRAVGRDRAKGAHVANNVAGIRIAATLIAAVLSGLIGVALSDSATVSALMVVFAVALAGRAASLWADDMFQAYEANHFSFRQAKIFRTSEVLLGIVLAIATEDIFWIAVGHAFVWVAQGARGIFLVMKNLQTVDINWRWAEKSSLLSTGILLGISGAFDTLMVQGGIILYRAWGAVDNMVGNMAVAIQAMVILGSLFLAFSRAALPAISRSVDRGGRNHRNYVSAMVRSAFVFGVLAVVWSLAIGADLVGFVLGKGYQAAGDWLWLMMLVLIPSIIKHAVNFVLVAHGEYGRVLFLSSAGVAVMAGTLLLLLESYGFAGAIVGIIAGFCVYASAGIAVLARMKQLDHIADIPKLSVLSALTVSIYFLASSYQPWVAALVATLVLFLGVLSLGVIRDTERMAIVKMIRRRKLT